MREERGPAQALTRGSAPADRSLQHPFRISTRHIPLVEFPVTHSKQRDVTFSTRHTFELAYLNPRTPYLERMEKFF